VDVFPSADLDTKGGAVSLDAVLLGQSEQHVVLLVVDPAKGERVALGLIQRGKASFSEEKGAVEAKIDARSWVERGRVWRKRKFRIE
jgi:hypothetical protein